MDFLEACRKFIAIDSTPGNGNRELALFAAQLCREAGLFVELQYENVNGVDQANVIARPIEVMPQDELLLQTHLDTVDPGNYALWSKTNANPFNASIYQDTLYGLGSADVKLDFLCKLKAIEDLKEKFNENLAEKHTEKNTEKNTEKLTGKLTGKFTAKIHNRPINWKTPFVLVGTFSEEQGMVGAVKLIRKKKIAAKRALVGEPTELRLVHALKGLASVEIEIPFSKEEMEFRQRHDQSESTSTQSKIFIGKAAHSVDPLSGESAIHKLFDYLTKLPEGLAVMEIDGGTNFNSVPAHAVLEIDMVGGLRDTIGRKIAHILEALKKVELDFQHYADNSFTPPQPTLNIGTIRTHRDNVKMAGCCRLPPTVTDETYESWMQVLRNACESVGAVFHVTDYKRSFRTPLSSSFVKICQGELENIGLSAPCSAHAVTNEANVFSRFGIECVVVGPGRGLGNSHGPDENIAISQLHEAARFYKGVIERVCL